MIVLVIEKRRLPFIKVKNNVSHRVLNMCIAGNGRRVVVISQDFFFIIFEKR